MVWPSPSTTGSVRSTVLWSLASGWWPGARKRVVISLEAQIPTLFFMQPIAGTANRVMTVVEPVLKFWEPFDKLGNRESDLYLARIYSFTWIHFFCAQDSSTASNTA
jgi:hypothetical protein